jgi:hypothetical protein
VRVIRLPAREAVTDVTRKRHGKQVPQKVLKQNKTPQTTVMASAGFLSLKPILLREPD